MPPYRMERMPMQGDWQELLKLIPPLWRWRKELNVQELANGDLIRLKSGQHTLVLEVTDPIISRTKVISHTAGIGVYKFPTEPPRPGSTIYLPVLKRGEQVQLHEYRFRKLRLAIRRPKH